MDNKWRRFAPICLYVSLAAAIISVGLYIVQRQVTLALEITLGFVIIGLALFAVLDPNRVRAALTGRQARYGSNALVLTIAFLGILVVVNYLVFNNSKRWDLTEGQQNTLSPETLTTLTSLSAPVKAQAFFSSNIPTDQAKSILDEYRLQSKGKFQYEFIDPVKNPVAAQQAKIAQDGSVVLMMGANQQVVTTVSEQDLTNGLVRLINPEKRVVYFLTGHGERSIDQSDNKNFMIVKTYLESKNYTVDTLNLLADKTIPLDAKVIVIAGPDKPVSQDEVTLLDQYLAKGGALIIMEEPVALTQFGDSPDPLADFLSKNWGITLAQDIVVDPTSGQLAFAVGLLSADHPITQKLTTYNSIMPTARSLTISNTSSGKTLSELVNTTPNAWGETDTADFKAGNQPKFDSNTDTKGPVILAIAAEDFQNQGRVVVFGDVDFASDGYLQAFANVANANLDLFVNSVDWAAGQENIINLTPKQTKTRMMLPPQQTAMNLIMLGTVFIIPGLALVAGIGVFIQRRRRG
jgi:ABC-type uncharacterized transport system involved in gliding motility auxiliary subunit